MMAAIAVDLTAGWVGGVRLVRSRLYRSPFLQFKQLLFHGVYLTHCFSRSPRSVLFFAGVLASLGN